MANTLIYHTNKSKLGGRSPFDEHIQRLCKESYLRIVYPYLNFSYFQKLILHNNLDWLLITDIPELFSSISTKERIRWCEFIKTNISKIRHVYNLHAKLIFNRDIAIIGSANFTFKGLTEREELSVMIDNKENIDELKSWYDKLWKIGDEIDLINLEQISKEIEKPKNVYAGQNNSGAWINHIIKSKIILDEDKYGKVLSNFSYDNFRLSDSMLRKLNYLIVNTIEFVSNRKLEFNLEPKNIDSYGIYIRFSGKNIGQNMTNALTFAALPKNSFLVKSYLTEINEITVKEHTSFSELKTVLEKCYLVLSKWNFL